MSFIDRLRTQKLLSFTLVVFTLCIGIVIGTLITVNWGVKAARDSQAAPGATPLTIPSPVELSNEFTRIAKDAEPSVVNVSVQYLPKAPQRTQTQTRRRGAQPAPSTPFGDQGDDDQGDDNGGMQDFFNRFFGGSPFGQGGPQMPDQGRGRALGSGVVVDKAGYVLTNNHVVEKADKITVRFKDDPTEYPATVVGTDEKTDLAVLRVTERTSFTPAKIGNSDAVRVGDWAVAIGSPFDFENTVTAGIISATARDMPAGEASQYQHFLQTDAAINPGNSGGPLLNIRGEVIGINTAIATRSGGYQGIGFALPINTAADVYNQIIKSGKVTRGSIGITYVPSNTPNARNLLKANNLTEGVFVEQVPSGGPAAKAGVEPGDIIVSLNGKPVREGNDLVNVITATPIGSPVTLGIVRDGKRETYKVTVADITQVFPEQFGGAAQPENAGPGKTSVKFGMSIESLTDQKRQSLAIKQSGGVLVDSVEPGSFAEDIGLQQNDLIISINRQNVTSYEDVQRIQAALKPGQAVQFQILRRAGRNGGDWSTFFVAGALPASDK
jgi:serine protease Do